MLAQQIDYTPLQPSKFKLELIHAVEAQRHMIEKGLGDFSFSVPIGAMRERVEAYFPNLVARWLEKHDENRFMEHQRSMGFEMTERFETDREL